LSADCLLFRQLIVYFCQLIVYFCQLIVYNLNFRAKNLVFPRHFGHNSFFNAVLFTFVSCLFTFLSADCLLFRQLIVYFCQLIVYFCQLIVYNLNFRAKNLVFPRHFGHNSFFNAVLFTFVSCLFTFLSADCLQFEFSRQKPCFSMTFLPVQMLQHFNCKLKKKISVFCHFSQLLSADFNCLFTFCQLKSAVCLLLSAEISCLFTFVSWFQLFVYFLSADFSCLFTFCQLKSAVCLLFVSW